MEWLEARGYVLVLTRAEHVLNSSQQDFEALLKALASAAVEWAEDRRHEPYFPRSAVPFHVIFHCEAAAASAIEARLTQLVGQPNRIEIGRSLVE
jgi:hypothetical protein